MQRPCELLANRVDNVGLPLEGIQRLADILTMQFAQGGVGDVVEQGSREDTLVACEVDRLQEWRLVHVVGRTPRTVYPVGTSFQYVVLEVMLILEEHADGFSLLGELLQAPEIPLVQCREVVLRHAVPG